VLASQTGRRHLNLETELMQILKGTGIDWCRIRLKSKLYIEQCESVTGPRGGNKCEDGKLDSTRMLFATDFY
jgi:arabinogalactan endo-1,4-beta-galactosidase